MKYLECAPCGQRAAWITFWVNVGGAIVKGTVGYFGNSKALVADAFHSSADAMVGLVTVISLKISGEGANKRYPYGHGKVEYIGAAGVTVALLAAVVFLVREAIYALHHGSTVTPHFATLLTVLIAIASSEMLFRLNLCTGKQLGSPVLIANAWHNRYDVYTSVVVLLGIIGAMLGFRNLDPLAAIGVGVVIIKVSYEILSEAWEGLMDKALPEEDREEIVEVVLRACAKAEIAHLRTRRVGQKNWIDLGIRLDPKTSVAQAYAARETIRNLVFLRVENVAEVQVEVFA
ncbi:MAG: hypothetical protein COB53_10875 [Elusimicrobia bacterium]|nr:MAG: hypothetical protein COB53_10875 [Elusimicrobiota bacterium]